MPKAGSHLLKKVISLLPRLCYAGVTIERATADSMASISSVESDGATIPVGVDWPVPVPVANVEAALRRIEPGSYGEAFMPYSPAAETLLGSLGIQVVLMLRDPRDVVVSHAHFVAGHAAHFLHEHYQGLSPEQRLTTSIAGLAPATPGGPLLLDIGRRAASMAAWIGKPQVFRTDFSRLVGPRGGGSAETQQDELRRLVAFIGLDCRDEELSHIADTLFGGTATFRSGTIASWRQEFTAEHKQLFKDLAGKLLIDLGYERDMEW
jgi:hypothetical protein